MITVSGLVKRFHTSGRTTLLAVDQLSFRVEPGEVYGLLGPNGAGKTTTLRILATLMEPDEGQVLIAGIDRRRDPIGVRERLGWVPAEAGLPERLTPREAILLFAAVQGVPRPEQRTDEMLEQLGATPYANTPCGSLSTGMKRRVVLARALIHDPPVLLLDEPTDGLDVAGRRDVLGFVSEQARLGKTVIISSHIMSEVEKVAHRLGLVAGGKMVAEGRVDELLTLANATGLDEAFLSLVDGPKA